ncbi:MAG: hypothetical protein H0T70_03215 [Acidimicrobiia bacterium]|nr:hypothetical protein [Acidimicrobiia bacterium]
MLGIVINDLDAKELIENAYRETWGWLEGKEAFVLTELGESIRRFLEQVQQPEEGGG